VLGDALLPRAAQWATIAQGCHVDRSAAWLAVLLALLVGARAFGDDSAQAKARFKSGLKHFDLAEYQEALVDFKEAYRLREDPVFLYNIAQCYRLLNDNADAITFYRNYLRRLPDAPNRGEVEAKIATLKQAVETQEKASKMPPNHILNEGGEAGATSPPPPATTNEPTPSGTAPTSNALTASAPPEKKPLYKQWWLWTTVGAVVVVGVAVGVGVGVGTSHASSPFPLVNF
jgi:tetratricopeptide (TPR) repeat protein